MSAEPGPHAETADRYELARLRAIDLRRAQLEGRTPAARPPRPSSHESDRLARLREGKPARTQRWLGIVSDPEVVLTSELAAVVLRWLERENRRSGFADSNNGNGGSPGFQTRGTTMRAGDPANERMPLPLSAAVKLALDAGCDPSVITKLLAGADDGTAPRWTTLSKADALLTAAGEAHALHDGRISVVPNPTWDLLRWERHRRETGCDRELSPPPLRVGSWDGRCYSPGVCGRAGRCVMTLGPLCQENGGEQETTPPLFDERGAARNGGPP